MIRLIIARCAWAATFVAVSALPASARQAGPAQAPQAPPVGTSGQGPRAWFGGGTGSVGQTLTGNISLGGGTFRRELDPSASPQQTPTTVNSSIAYLSGSLSYALDAGRGTLSAGYTGYGNYYAELADEFLVGHSGSVAGSFRFSDRTTVTGNQGVFYAPPITGSLQGIFGGGGQVSETIDPGAVEARSLSYYTGLGLSHKVTSRSDLTLGYSHRRTSFSVGPEADDQIQIADDAAARFSHRFGSYVRVYVGYSYGTSRTGDDPDAPRIHRSSWDAGLDFSRDFSVQLTESTSLSFGVGTTVATSGDTTRFLLTGNVLLSQRIRRSGNASVYYRREANFVPGITEIVISDGVGGEVGGSLSRRVRVNATADYRRANIGLENVNSIRATSAGGGASISLARDVGSAINYFYTRSSTANSAFLLTRELQDFEGHRVSASLGWRYVTFGVSYARHYYQSRTDQSLTGSVSLFAPLFARTRRGNATR